MSKVPELSYPVIVSALRRDGWIVVRRKGSHLQLQRRANGQTQRITLPAHRPVKRSTLAKVLKQAGIDVDRFLELL
jgi:predicted RNA binding protein YcfA (HicA-like mRNA interferase family)